MLIYINTVYSLGFDSRSEFYLQVKAWGKNIIIFGADMSSSVRIDNTKKGILIIGDGPTQGSDNTALIAEDEYTINFTQPGK